MNFGLALEEVKKGKGMRLPNWSKDEIIRAEYPNGNSMMTEPFLYIENKLGKVPYVRPWKETMIELFSENWEVID